MLAGLPLAGLTKKAWTAAVVDQVLEAADILDDASRRDELVTQSRTFLFRVLGMQVHTFADSDPAQPLRGVRGDAEPRRRRRTASRRSYTRSIALVDTETGTRWLRLSDFREWWREQEGKASWAQARSIAREVGWRAPGELKVRRPKAIRTGRPSTA